MNLRLNKKQIIIVILSIMIVTSSYLFAHFSFIQPLQNKKIQAEETLNIEKQLYEKVKEKAQGQTTSSEETSYQLQKQVPVEPLYDQLFLELEEAKTVSNTIIEQYQIVSEENESTDTIEQFQLDLRNNDETEEEESENNTTSSTLEKATISVLVHADSYEEMKTFIQNLEENERIITIDELTYIDEEEEDYFSFQLTFSAYYVKGLNDLKEEAPKIDILEPSEKENPFNNN